MTGMLAWLRQRDVAAMAAGYLAVWLLFSVAATLLQRVLSGWLLLTPMMEAASPRAGGVLLLTAGIYQWSLDVRPMTAYWFVQFTSAAAA